MIKRNDRRAEITHDFEPGQEYEFIVRAVGPDGTQQPVESAARNTIVIKGKLTAPSAPAGLVAMGFLNSITLAWTNPDNYDLDRIEIWRGTVDNVEYADLLAEVSGTSYIDAIGSANVTRYYWVRAVNTSGVRSDFHPDTAAGVGATTEGVDATDIDDFAVTATKMFTNTIILNGDVWTNNSPGAGSIAWNAHSIVYNGASYPITAGNTSSYYVYWTIGNTTYTGSATHPVLGTTAFMIAVNQSGIHTLVWNSSANMVIGTAFIANLAVTEAKINSLAVTQGKIGLLAVGEAQIANLAVTNAKIANATIEYAKIKSVDATTITTGTLTGRTVQTAASGQRAILEQSDNTLRFHTATVSNVIVIDDNIVGSRPGMAITDATNGAVIGVTKDANNRVSISDLGIAVYSETNYYNFYGKHTVTGTIAMLHLETGAGDTTPFIWCDTSAARPFIVYNNGNVYVKGSIEIDGVLDADGGADIEGNADIAGNLDVHTGLDVTGNITVTGTVDGVDVADHSARHENGGADEISVAGLSGTLADAQPTSGISGTFIVEEAGGQYDWTFTDGRLTARTV